MPRILAIDWDRLEARALCWCTRGRPGASIVGAWTVVARVGRWRGARRRARSARGLAAAVGSAASGNATTLVGVGRDQVQMVLLSLPPAPLEELPELVRFQAERELHLARRRRGARLHSALRRRHDAAPGARRRALGQRHHRSAAAVRRRSASSRIASRCGPPRRRRSSSRRMVHRRERSLAGRQSAQRRSRSHRARGRASGARADGAAARCRAKRPAARQALAGEIRRTIAAVRQQLGEQQVSRVILCGTASEADDAAKLWRAIWGCRSKCSTWSENAPAGLGEDRPAAGEPRAVRRRAGHGAGRSGSPTAGGRLPQRPPPHRSPQVHAAACARWRPPRRWWCLFFGVVLWKRSHRSAAEIARINAETAAAENEFKQHASSTRCWPRPRRSRSWLATDVNWLDELDRLSAAVAAGAARFEEVSRRGRRGDHAAHRACVRRGTTSSAVAWRCRPWRAASRSWPRSKRASATRTPGRAGGGNASTAACPAISGRSR